MSRYFGKAQAAPGLPSHSQNLPIPYGWEGRPHAYTKARELHAPLRADKGIIDSAVLFYRRVGGIFWLYQLTSQLIRKNPKIRSF